MDRIEETTGMIDLLSYVGKLGENILIKEYIQSMKSNV